MACTRPDRGQATWLDRRQVKYLAFAVFVILLLVGLMTGFNIAVAAAFKDTYLEPAVRSSANRTAAVLTDGAGAVAGTAEAIVELPLYAVPHLPPTSQKIC